MITPLVWAEPGPGMKTLSPNQWMAAQVTEAENRVARLSNRITAARSKEKKPIEINKIEAELRVAKEYVKVVKELNIEDYFNFYLSELSNDEEAFAEAARGMSKDEVTTLLKTLLKERGRSREGAPGASTISVLAPTASEPAQL